MSQELIILHGEQNAQKMWKHLLRLLEESGTEVTWVEAGVEAGQGRAIRFKFPSEHSFEIYYDVEKTLAAPERSSVLKNQTYKSWAKGVSPRRIDHVNLLTSMLANEVSDFLEEKLGFKMRECVKAPDNSLVGAWLSVTPFVHDIAISHDPHSPTPNQIHHISYWLDNSQDLLRAADILK